MRVRHIRGIVAALVLFMLATVHAQDPVPTLVPPTPIAVPDDGAGDALASDSALARIQADGRVRVGILFNQPPFGELNIRGEVVGYDADLARALAEAWGVEVAFVQVTRQTAVPKLTAGEVDLLIAAQVHRRALDTQVEFSLTYYQGEQAVMVRLDDTAQSPADLAGRRVGVVMGTPSEEAAAYWQRRAGASIEVRAYLTIDQALVGLVNGEVDGVVDKRYLLRDLLQPDALRVLEVGVQPEPYAVALRRQDVNLRNLVNRTLQHLAATGRIAEIHSEHFPSRYPDGLIPLWEGLGDAAPTPATYPADVPYPQFYRVPLIQANGVLRVAGVPQPIPDEPEAARRVATANARLAEALAARWGVGVQYVNTDDPLGAVERGEADIALGVRPTWDAVNRVDFTSVYLLRGKRLMTTVRDDFTTLGELRGKWVGVFASEPGAAEQVVALGQQVNAVLRTFTITDDSAAAYEMLEENNVDAVFGDSVRLLPFVQADPETLKFSDRCETCDPWYTREYYGAAVPRNDIDFRLFVEYTLQELWLDGTMGRVLEPVTVNGQTVTPDIWPGSAEYMGVALGGEGR